MKIPLPKTLPGAFLPMIIVNLIFGIGVIHYPFGKPRPIISAIWSIIHIVIYWICVLVTEFPHSDLSATAYQNYRNFSYLSGIAFVISLGISHVQSKNFSYHFQKIIDINNRMERFDVSNDYGLTFKSQIIQFNAFFIWFIIIFVLDLIYIPYQNPSQPARISYLFCIHHWLIFPSVIDFLCIYIIRYFGNRFEHLNSLLSEENIHKIFEKSFNLETNDRNLPSYSLTVREIRRNLPATDEQGILKSLKEFRKIHRDLCNTVTELNKTFGIQLHLSMALSICLVTALLYNFYIFLLTSVETRPLGIIIVLPVWIGFYACKVYLIIHVGETTMREARRTGQLIHTLLNSTIIYNRNVRHELNIFSLQLIQNPLILTVSKFFELNHALGYRMVASISTFLIVMIQIRGSYEL